MSTKRFLPVIATVVIVGLLIVPGAALAKTPAIANPAASPDAKWRAAVAAASAEYASFYAYGGRSARTSRSINAMAAASAEYRSFYSHGAQRAAAAKQYPSVSEISKYYAQFYDSSRAGSDKTFAAK